MSTEKLIITLWRGEIRNYHEELHGVYCILRFGKEERRSKTVYDIKLLPWKQTFVFSLPHSNDADLKMQFVNLQQGQEIHFSQGSIASTISFARAMTNIPIEQHSTKGTVPKKLDIVDEGGTNIGKVFLQYELLRSQVKYMVQKPIQYNYLLSLSQIKVSLVRNLKEQPIFFLQSTMGEQVKKEQFAMNCINGDFIYNYPVKFYVKNQQMIKFELVGKAGLTNHVNDVGKKSRPTSEDSKNNLRKNNKKKLSIATNQLFSVLDLIYPKNTTIQEKIPLYIPPQRQVGYMQFQAEVIYKSKEELQEQTRQRNEDARQNSMKKRQVNIKAHNGNILVNSIIVRMEPFNEQMIHGKDFSVELKIGKQKMQSSTLQNPGRELIFIDSFKFKRTWEEKLQFSVIMKDSYKDPPEKIPLFFTQANLRELFDTGRFLAKHLILVDEERNYSGEVIVDVAYAEQEKKKQTLSVSKEVEKSQEEKKEDERIQKLEKIRERMKLRLEAKEQRSQILGQNNHSLLLPPISQRSTIADPNSPSRRRRGAGSVSGNYSPRQSEARRLGLGDPKRNIYNKGNDIKFSRSPRFKDEPRQLHNDLFFYKGNSDFEKKNKGPHIGYGGKVDFTKDARVLPGVGRYQIPSLWDKYV